MKYPLIALTLLAFGAASIKATLVDDIAYIRQLVPFDQMQQITEDYRENYESVAEVFNYFKSDAFKAAWLDVATFPEFVSLIHFLDDKGTDIYDLLNRFAEKYGLPTVERTRRGARPARSLGTNAGWDAMIKEILAIYPREELLAFLETQVAAGGEMAQLHEKLDELHYVFHDIMETPSVALVGLDMRHMGVDIDRILEVIMEFFGWHQDDHDHEH